MSVQSVRFRDNAVTSNERNWALWVHLSPLLAFFIAGPFAVAAPLILWLIKKDESAFVDDHGRECLNMAISGAIFFVIGIITSIGMIFWLAWAIVALIGVIRGSVAASAGEYFRYPMTIRFLN